MDVVITATATDSQGRTVSSSVTVSVVSADAFTPKYSGEF